MTDAARSTSVCSPAVSRWLLWGTWLVGPASYGTAFLGYWVVPELCYGTADPGPDVLLAMVMVVTHLVAGASTALMLLLPGPHWRAAEFWVLLVYWAGIVGWLAPGVWVSADRVVDPTYPWLCTRISAIAVVLMPAAGLARRVVARSAATAS